MDALSFLHATPFYELAALLALAAVVGYLALLLRQPMIVAFIAVGVLVGDAALGIVRSHEQIDLLAELGVTVLLFLVGLKLDISLVRTLGAVSLATGLGQVLFTSVIGFGIGLALGLDTITAVYVAVALTFSSTIIVVKLLTDKKEADALHGRIAIGFLIVQDLVVVLAMMVLSAMGIGAEPGEPGSAVKQIAQVLLYGVVALVAVGFFIRYVADPLVTRGAHSPELLTTFAIGWAALLAALGSYLGLSKELGGLLAGVALASTPLREAIVSRLSSMRDFLLLFFFIALGASLELDTLGAQFGAALVFSVFVLIGNPLIVMIIMGFMGYRKRTGFLAGLTVAQISEFSLIFMTMGISVGHLNAESLGLVTLVGLITIALSVYMITYSHFLYRWLEPVLTIFERRTPFREVEADTQAQSHLNGRYDIILVGLGRYGSAIAERFREHRMTVLGVDINPEVLQRWQSAGFDVMYGDACDEESLSSLPLAGVKWVVSAMPEHDLGITHQDPRLVLIGALKRQGYTGLIAVSAHHQDQVERLVAHGANAVFMPFQDAAEIAVTCMRSKMAAPGGAS